MTAPAPQTSPQDQSSAPPSYPVQVQVPDFTQGHTAGSTRSRVSVPKRLDAVAQARKFVNGFTQDEQDEQDERSF